MIKKHVKTLNLTKNMSSSTNVHKFLDRSPDLNPDEDIKYNNQRCGSGSARWEILWIRIFDAKIAEYGICQKMITNL